jgi:hypothetical protein
MALIRNAARDIFQKTANDVVILSSARSPITRAFKGGFRHAYPEDILIPVSEDRGKFRRLFIAELRFIGGARGDEARKH